MNFTAHAIGGTVTSSLVTGTIYYCYEKNILTDFEPNYAFVFLSGLAFSLFPDLDTKSTPQKWFYRGIFILLGILAFLHQYKLATYISMFSITPLLFKHRYWTHWWSCSMIIPIILFYVIDYCIFNKTSIDLNSYKHYCFYSLSATIGWMTHLVLDRVRPDL